MSKYDTAGTPVVSCLDVPVSFNDLCCAVEVRATNSTYCILFMSCVKPKINTD